MPIKMHEMYNIPNNTAFFISVFIFFLGIIFWDNYLGWAGLWFACWACWVGYFLLGG